MSYTRKENFPFRIDFVKFMHNKGASDDSNSIAVICKMIELHDVFPNFQQDLISIIQDNLNFFARNSSYFYDAERFFLRYKQGVHSKLTNEELDEIQLVLDKAKQLSDSFNFLGDLYLLEFTSDEVVIEFLHNLSIVPAVSNQSIECFLNLFTAAVQKILHTESIIAHLKLNNIVKVVLESFKYCPKTPKTDLLKSSLINKAQVFLNYEIIDIDEVSEVSFPLYESDWKPQLVSEPLWD